MFFSSGGSIVNSGSIVDGEIINADINAAAAIAQSKIAASLGGDTDLFSVEQGTSATQSLTTVAGQRVFVICRFIKSLHGATVSLKYNGVTKDSITWINQSYAEEGMLMYSEVPGAGTANITLETTAGTFSEIKMIVLKLRSA